MLFHKTRNMIPISFIKDSLPSILVIPVMLGVTELFPSIRFHSVRNKILITFTATIFIALWFEYIVPLFYSPSTPDIGDAVGIFIGWIFYISSNYRIKNNSI